VQPQLVLSHSYNVSSVRFQHALSDSPLFNLQALAGLAHRRAAVPKGVYCSVGPVCAQDSWQKGQCGTSALQEVLDNISTGNSLIVIKGVESDNEYSGTMKGLMASIVAQCGSTMANDVIRARATLFLASPYRVTTYHIDADTNFLFQLRGSKDFYVYPDARDLLPNIELEAYFGGDPSAAKYREQYEGDGIYYVLDSTAALHVPSLFPHWARNRAGVSVALSINFDLKSMEKLAGLHRFNRRLRGLGFEPTPPGASKSLDGLKTALMSVGRSMRDFSRRSPAGLAQRGLPSNELFT